MTREATATGTIPTGNTVAATARLTRCTAGHAVQRTRWKPVVGDNAAAAPPTDATVSPQITARPTALPTALHTAHLIALHTAHPADTGLPTTLGTTPPPDANTIPQTLTAATPPRRDRGASTRSPTE
ncbi:hypothetical protein KUDE01_004893 [Dissostichus eleginoides]|uniref:Uncharacterized protein n=1 Tax=Dissostichus eleginoides TaxID=100907 RepID=A0AAD9CIZ8_DISEL|nr:hypothetical protein KUDE01_004893 [Dissostichus eleginoides]